MPRVAVMGSGSPAAYEHVRQGHPGVVRADGRLPRHLDRLVADIDLAQIIEAKYDFDVIGHYARPDVFKLVVNELATPAVVATRTLPSKPFG